MLRDKLDQDLKGALKARNDLAVSVIRMLKADMTNTAIKLKKDSLDDSDVLKIIQQHISRHKDSIEQFKKGKRDDLAQKEERELKILEGYVPEQMSDAELEKIAKSVIEEIGSSAKSDMGRIIKAVLDKTKSKADGKRVSLAVSKFIAG